MASLKVVGLTFKDDEIYVGTIIETKKYAM